MSAHSDHPYGHTDAFWVGSFAASIALSLPKITERPKEARADLKRCLDEFLRSPLPSDELRTMLRGMR